MIASYETAGGSTVTVGFRYAIAGPVHTYECAGCDGIRGFKTEYAAIEYAKKHAARCTDRPGDGGTR